MLNGKCRIGGVGTGSKVRGNGGEGGSGIGNDECGMWNVELSELEEGAR
jgi:hypothetical protein